MTIKEAFDKLTAITGSAMKNPFFINRRLHETFSDIADEVDGDYHKYSTTEKVVGVWLDNKTIYEKTFTFEVEKQITGDTWNTNFVTITGINNIISAYSIGSSGAFYPLMATISSDTVSVMSCRNSGNSYAKHFVIRYTK